MTAIAVSVAAVLVAAMALVFGLQWLKRRSVDFEHIRREHVALLDATNAKLEEMRRLIIARDQQLETRDAQWAQAFEGHVDHLEQRALRVEQAMRSVDTSFQPLGKRYDTRLRS